LDLPYLQSSRRDMIRKRARWLTILLIGEMLTATALGFFQDALDEVTILALFLPLIISSGGNSGSQASTLVIRAMALGEVRLADWWRVIRREALSGLMMGAILGAIGFARVMLWHFVFHAYGAHYWLVAGTIGFSVVGVV